MGFNSFSLAKFWNMPDEVAERGQHNSTLNNKEKNIDIKPRHQKTN